MNDHKTGYLSKSKGDVELEQRVVHIVAGLFMILLFITSAWGLAHLLMTGSLRGLIYVAASLLFFVWGGITGLLAGRIQGWREHHGDEAREGAGGPGSGS